MLASACKAPIGRATYLATGDSLTSHSRKVPPRPTTISSGTLMQQSLVFVICVVPTLQRPDSFWALGSWDHSASSTHFSGMSTQLSFELVSWPHLVYAQALVSDCWQAKGHRDPVTLPCRGGAQDRQLGSLEVDR